MSAQSSDTAGKATTMPAEPSPPVVDALATAVADKTALVVGARLDEIRQETAAQLDEIRQETAAQSMRVMDHVRKEFVEHRLSRAYYSLRTAATATVGLAMMLPPGLWTCVTPGALGLIWSIRADLAVAKNDDAEVLRLTSVTRPLTPDEAATVCAAPLAKFMDFFEYAAYPLLFLPLTPSLKWLAGAWLGGAAVTVLAAPRIFRKLCRRAGSSLNIRANSETAGGDAASDDAAGADSDAASGDAGRDAASADSDAVGDAAGAVAAGANSMRWYRGISRELATGGFFAAMLVARLLNLPALIFKPTQVEINLAMTMTSDHPMTVRMQPVDLDASYAAT